jgi:iron-sulfur cluster assembly protein
MTNKWPRPSRGPETPDSANNRGGAGVKGDDAGRAGRREENSLLEDSRTMTDQQAPVSEEVIRFTPEAIREVKRLLDKEETPDLFLRLGVEAGGCSGLSYVMTFDNQATDLDREFEFDGLKVRVDLKALMHLKGTTLDYRGGLMGGGFTFSNPNAKRSCGCGSSFTC